MSRARIGAGEGKERARRVRRERQRERGRRGLQRRRTVEKADQKRRMKIAARRDQKERLDYSHGSRRKPKPAEAKEARGVGKEQFLPFHLILGRLPVRQLLQLRSVDKLWNSMLGADALASGVIWNWNAPGAAAGMEEEYWFVMSRTLPGHGRRTPWKFLYTCSRQPWDFFKAPLPSRHHGVLADLLGGRHCNLLTSCERPHYILSNDSKPPRVSRCTPQLVSAGGLMCALVHRPGASDDYPVIVFNCITGSVKVLPPLINRCNLAESPSLCSLFMGIDEDDPSRYYIMVSSNGTWIPAGMDFYCEIYDSRRGYWRVENNLVSVLLTANSSMFPRADFFFYAEFRRGNDSTATMLGYHAAHDAWSKVQVPLRTFDRLGTRRTFLKYNGRFLQGRNLNAFGCRCIGFVVQELKFNSNNEEVASWVEVARTPEHFLDGAPYGYWVPKLKSEGSLFYMMFEDNDMDGRYSPTLVYDIAQNSWYSVPLRRGFGCISVHRPRLSLRVPHLEGEQQI